MYKKTKVIACGNVGDQNDFLITALQNMQTGMIDFLKKCPDTINTDHLQISVKNTDALMRKLKNKTAFLVDIPVNNHLELEHIAIDFQRHCGNVEMKVNIVEPMAYDDYVNGTIEFKPQSFKTDERAISGFKLDLDDAGNFVVGDDEHGRIHADADDRNKAKKEDAGT